MITPAVSSRGEGAVEEVVEEVVEDEVMEDETDVEEELLWHPSCPLLDNADPLGVLRASLSQNPREISVPLDHLQWLPPLLQDSLGVVPVRMEDSDPMKLPVLLQWDIPSYSISEEELDTILPRPIPPIPDISSKVPLRMWRVIHLDTMIESLSEGIHFSISNHQTCMLLPCHDIPLMDGTRHQEPFLLRERKLLFLLIPSVLLSTEEPEQRSVYLVLPHQSY